MLPIGCSLKHTRRQPVRLREIVIEAKPVKPNKPLNPKQATARAERIKRAQASIQDVQIMNTIKLRKARNHLTQL